MRNDQGEQRIACGYQKWAYGTAAIERLGRRQTASTPAVRRQVAAGGAWTDEQTFVVQLWWYETPFGRTLTCRFDGDSVVVEQCANVSFGSTDRPTLLAHL